jgi:2-polyprenyl-6-methoxyphenol hydroxylase-like FAD-dependent oxidoreductase
MASRHAVVIGGSLAGLCAARALSRSFDRVTVLEQDAVPYGPCRRPGVPQTPHAHLLLARGLRELERLFPGFSARLGHHGALALDTGRDLATLRSQGWRAREDSGIEALFASRELVEATVRERLQKTPNVAFRDRSCVTRLMVRCNGSQRVIGVVVQGASGDPRPIPADLVVDAGGRASRAPQWLADAGIAAPKETRVESHRVFSARWFEAPKPEERPSHWWWQGIRFELPDHEVIALLLPVENRRWIVCIGTGNPLDEASFLPFLERLPSPLLAEAVRRAEPISPVYNSGATANRFRHYERWRATVSGFFAVGDAVCALDPAAASGMSCAALSARVIEETLDRAALTSGPEIACRLFRRQARVLGDAWRLAVGTDLCGVRSAANFPAFPTSPGDTYSSWATAQPTTGSRAETWMRSLSFCSRPRPSAHRPRWYGPCAT